LRQASREGGFDQPPAQRKVVVVFRQRPDRVKVIGQDNNRVDVERMTPPDVTEGAAQTINVIGEQMQPTLAHIGREEKAATADEVAPIVCHRASIAQRKRWVSLRSTHPTGFSMVAHFDDVRLPSKLSSKRLMMSR